MTAVLDAADRGLVERWGCENLMLDTFTGLETFAGSGDQPESVTDVRAWVEDRAPDPVDDDGEANYDTNDQILRDLGYIQ